MFHGPATGLDQGSLKHVLAIWHGARRLEVVLKRADIRALKSVARAKGRGLLGRYRFHLDEEATFQFTYIFETEIFHNGNC